MQTIRITIKSPETSEINIKEIISEDEEKEAKSIKDNLTEIFNKLERNTSRCEV
ncbi:hypothetical protein [Caloranaerobacter ferrireducens]|uniref:hypothetical protein n=1 Tax=Caloranaerobacter ferrireducens TaxID=1323370 RepID=UPI00159F0C08|nr:hypothetical protein [Caloranaerobacter ferrireducens]